MDKKNKKYMLLITGMVMGGAERVMATIANELVERGNEVILVTMREPKSAYRLDKRVKFIGANGILEAQSGIKRRLQLLVSGVKGVRFYIKQLKDNNPDIVISFLTNTNLMAVAVNKLYLKDIPVIISERADPKFRGKFMRRICEWIYPKSSCIVCQSNTVGKYFKEVNEKATIEVIPNPINEECISYKVPTKRRKIIVAVGRLSEQKNFQLLINSFNLIKDEFKDYSVEIFGQGPEKENLLCLIRELDLEDNVRLMGIKDNVMKSVYDASLYVMPSNFEGFPNALIEAMASGLPVICTDFPTGTAREVIEDGINGYIVPVGGEKEMAGAMKSILLNSSLQEKMSIENRKILEILDKKKIIDKWVDVMNKYIN